MPLVQSIFNRTLIDMGQEVTNHCMSSRLQLSSVFALTLFSMPSLSILASRPLPYNRRKTTKNLFGHNENRGKEP